MSVKVREKDKGSGVWWLFINHNGQRRSKRIGNKAEAVKLAKIIEGKLVSGDLGVLQDREQKKPFSYYCNQWITEIMPTECRTSTQEGYISIHRLHLKKAPFYDKPVDQITENDVETYLIKKRKIRARSTCVHIKNAISNSFKRALKSRVIKTNPCAGISIPKNSGKKGKVLREPYNEQEIDQLLNVFKGSRFYTMVLFMCRTGCRTSEVAGLQWDDIDLDRRKARIHRGVVRGRVTDTTKSGKERYIDLTPALVAELRKQKIKNQSRGAWVFQGTAGCHIDIDNFRERNWYPTLEKNGLPRVRIHDLRHSYATFLIRMTKDIFYAQKQLGHHSIQVTVDRYGHLLEDDTKTRLVDVLDDAVTN